MPARLKPNSFHDFKANGLLGGVAGGWGGGIVAMAGFKALRPAPPGPPAAR